MIEIESYDFADDVDYAASQQQVTVLSLNLCGNNLNILLIIIFHILFNSVLEIRMRLFD